MKVLLAILLALSQMPSEVDYKKAMDKLATTPNDPEANTTAGKYLAFVLGDYEQGMLFLSKSADKTLRTLAEHERAPLYADTPAKKIGMGDEWVTASKNFQPLCRAFFARASWWYAQAWPDLDPVWKEKARAQGLKLAAAKPAGSARKGLPTGWAAEAAVPGNRPPLLDGTIARTGSYSVRILPGDEKIKGSFGALKSDVIPVAGGKTLEFSAFVRSEDTDNAADRIAISFFDTMGTGILTVGPFVPLDLPFWNKVSGKIDVPANASRAVFGAACHSKKGSIWIDDISVKVDGKEILKNASFEEK